MHRTTSRSRSRAVAKVVGVVVVVWVIAAAWLLGTAWYAVPGLRPAVVPVEASRVLSTEDYAARRDSHARPYVFEHGGPGGGRVLVFGAEHTKDPEDPQLRMIRTRWDDLQPTVALVEGDLGMLFPLFMDPVRTFGETGFVHALARRDDVVTRSWEPPDAAVLQGALDQGYTVEQVALRWVLNPYFSNLRHGRPEDPEAFVLDTLAERGQAPGIAGGLTTMDAVDRAWRKHFPLGPDWRDVSDQFGLPGFLEGMDLNRPRDLHLVACVKELMGRGERVFVICGSSHAVKIEPAITSLPDQP